MSKKKIEDLISSVKSVHTNEGDVALYKEALDKVPNIDHYGVVMVDRLVNDNYPNGNKAGRFLYNDLYHSGVFDLHFKRQYDLVKTINSIIPENSQKPIAVLHNSADKCVGYLVSEVHGMPLDVYLESGELMDMLAIERRMQSVSRVESFLSESEVYNILAKREPSYLARTFDDIKKYKISSQVYNERRAELSQVLTNLRKSVNTLHGKNIHHNRISPSNIIVDYDGRETPAVYLINPLNGVDAESTADKDVSDMKAVEKLILREIEKSNSKANKYEAKLKHLIK